MTRLGWIMRPHRPWPPAFKKKKKKELPVQSGAHLLPRLPFQPHLVTPCSWEFHSAQKAPHRNFLLIPGTGLTSTYKFRTLPLAQETRLSIEQGLQTRLNPHLIPRPCSRSFPKGKSLLQLLYSFREWKPILSKQLFHLKERIDGLGICLQVIPKLVNMKRAV